MFRAQNLDAIIRFGWMSKALEIGATSIILCHNHPSGNLKPSQSDMMLTEKIMKGSKLLDVKILDHVIVTEKSFFSFADEGRL